MKQKQGTAEMSQSVADVEETALPVEEGLMETSPTVKFINGPTILLQSGNYFDILNPWASTFTIEDIAHGLSNVCRFAGQCARFYSVAEHSYHVSRIVPPEQALVGLMHDASEAFIGDIAKPLKVLLTDYAAIEEGVMDAIWARFGLDQETGDIKHADITMLSTATHAGDARAVDGGNDE